MSYTPPAGNAVSFTFDGTSYTAPAGGAVDFSFSTDVSERTLSCAGAISLSGESGFMHYNYAMSAFGAIALYGTSEINSAPSLFCAGAISLGGGIELRLNRPLNASGGLALAGAALFNRGSTLSASGPVRLGGCANAAVGRVFSAAGRIAIGGEAAFRTGRKLTANGAILLDGSAAIQFHNGYQFSCNGEIRLFGDIRLFVEQHERQKPSLFVRTQSEEVIVYGV